MRKKVRRPAPETGRGDMETEFLSQKRKKDNNEDEGTETKKKET